jgi:hypothetical protein
MSNNSTTISGSTTSTKTSTLTTSTTTTSRLTTITASTKTSTVTTSTTTTSRLTTITASTKTNTVTTSSKTTSTVTSTIGTKCLDSDSNLCSQYAAAGYCIYSSVQNYCPLSCKVCIKPITTTSTSTTTTSSTTAKCLDSNSNICSQYAAAGYCIYSSVQSYCPLSCKMCIKPITTTSTSTTTTSSTTAKCLDSNSNICSQYAAAGYCSFYTSVQSYCPLSCKMCIKPITTTSTSTTTTSSTTTKCLDSNSNICPQYAAAGYCIYSSVQNYCPLSCKLCSSIITTK